MDNRKLKVLAAVVDEYIQTGEPVGSKKIADKLDIKVSSATIRNDMSTLEQLGLLMQPHTSAGRIPTYEGYRLYIKEIVGGEKHSLPEAEKERLDAMINNGEQTEEFLIQSATTALAEITNCAAVVTSNSLKFSVISKVEVIPTGRRLYVILLITSNGSIKNRACRLNFDLSDEQLDIFTRYIENSLEGVSVEDFSEEKLRDAATALGAYMTALSPLVEGLCQISRDMNSNEITMKGEENLYSCEEFERNDIVQFMSRKNELKNFLDNTFSGISVMFNEDNKNFVIGNSSILVSHYSKDGKQAGSLGVIGPLRLDYAKVIPYLEYFSNKLSNLITDKNGESYEENDEAGGETGGETEE